MLSKKVQAINGVIGLDMPAELADKILVLVREYDFPNEVCDDCLGNGVNIRTDRLCTKCSGTGEINR